jgi:hypothetical protein
LSTHLAIMPSVRRDLNAGFHPTLLLPSRLFDARDRAHIVQITMAVVSWLSGVSRRGVAGALLKAGSYLVIRSVTRLIFRANTLL